MKAKSFVGIKSAGSRVAGFASAPPAFDAVRLAPGTTLALAGEDLTVASLSGAGAVTGAVLSSVRP